MASSSKSKQQPQASTIILVAALVLLLVCTRGHAARPVPGSKNGLHKPQHAVSAATVAADHEKGGSGSGPGMEMRRAEPAEATRDCEGKEEEGEECLMRRTLVAHTDYIYTQGKHN